MSKLADAPLPITTSQQPALVTNQYGHFSPDGREFRITDVRTPRPWVNVIANPRFGLAVSQTGSGFTWVDNSQLAVINRWQQDLAQDASGKFLYLRDLELGQAWSLSPAPMWKAGAGYECRHGIGYTTFITEYSGLRSEWTLFAHPHDSVELWRIRIDNKSSKPKRIELTAFLEWCMGVTPASRREFQKLFLQTAFDRKHRAVLAWNHMWDVPGRQWGHWNTTFPYVAALAGTEPISAAEGDMAEFLGRYGSLREPAWLSHEDGMGRLGRHEDAIAALRSAITIPAGGSKKLGYVIAIADNRAEVERKIERNATVDLMDRCLHELRESWDQRLSAHRMQTAEPTLNYIVNDWARYQAISARIWGRAGYYQQSGAFGFRDQLQDSQVWLTIDPQQCREQLRLHAAHQFADGSVYHWWHPLTEQGHITRMTDDLLWLGFVTANYIKETGRLDVVHDEAPFVDEPRSASLMEHVQRAFERVFQRTSQRGIPLIGEGDWNDGLSAVGRQERGESVWLSHFLAGLLKDWAEIYQRLGMFEAADAFARRRARLVEAINTHCWDGQWFYRATLDSNEKLGSAENESGRIFLNAQTWAILNETTTPDRQQQCWRAVCDHLLSDVGALLLSPAYKIPREDVGYITRYAPGLRENGGVYTHAATWAIAAASKMRDARVVEKLLSAINPALKDPERYWAEPYVLPGNVDGPDSPHYGRGGWTWYTGSAAWLHRIVGEWVLGVRPTWSGLKLDPCLPASWNQAHMVRPYRGCVLDISITRENVSLPAPIVELNGKQLDQPLIAPPARAGERMSVNVRF